MPDHHTLLELVKISEALRDALREAYELARAGESGEPLRGALHFSRDLLDLANETLAGDPCDDRRTCRQCANSSPGGRCLAAWRNESLGEGVATGRTYEPDTARPQRCAAYNPGPDDADRRTGAARWPTLVAEKAEHYAHVSNVNNAHACKANTDAALQPI